VTSRAERQGMLWSRGVPVLTVLLAILGRARNECGVIPSPRPALGNAATFFFRFRELRLAGVADVGKGVPVLGESAGVVTKGHYRSLSYPYNRGCLMSSFTRAVR
jgi:hypothetical protein